MYQAETIDLVMGGRHLLEDASACVTPGKVTVFIGPNGAGKSTLLKVLAGEIRPHRGRVLLNGKDIRTLAPAHLAQFRAVVSQSAHVAFPFTVAEVVAIGTTDGRVDRGLAHKALEDVELSGFEDRDYDRLSGGERQRVQLARALVQLQRSRETGYLLLDEPTASLDLAQQVLVMRLMRRLAEERGVGVLAVLHDLNLAAMVADEIVALKEGRIVARGTPDKVIADDVLSALYGVRAQVGWVPQSPFLLPHSAWQDR